MESNARFAQGSNVGNGAHQVIEKAAAAARPAVDRLASSAHSAVDSIASATTSMAATLGRRGEQLRGAEARMMENTRSYVSRNPLTAIGIALAAGLVLSRMFTPKE